MLKTSLTALSTISKLSNDMIIEVKVDGRYNNKRKNPPIFSTL